MQDCTIFVLNGEQCLLTVKSAQLDASCLRNGPLLLDLLLAFARHALTIRMVVWAHLHVRIDGTLLFVTKQACVVFGKVLLLPLTDLAAHNEARAQLHGLRVDETRVRV